MRSLFLLIALFTIAQVATAQTVNGKITDNRQIPMPNASVSLLNARDSSLKKMNAADKEGYFFFEHITAGKYILMATSIGYTKTYSEVFKYDSINSITQNLIIDKSEVQLTGVVVTAKRPPIEMKAGKTVVNVDGQPTNAGLNVLEILEKSPGVSVDADGNVSLQGKGGVMILIDDKPTYLSGTQLAAFLKSIQANGLNQIEIMTSPPVKYDAEGGAGVINIKTKKGTIRGFNGNVDLNYIQGFYPKYNGGANLNYRNNKLNVFGSYNGGVWESLGTMTINRNFYKNGIFSDSSAQITNRMNDNKWHNARVGMDYYFTDKDVAGVVIRGGINEWEGNNKSTSNLYGSDKALRSILESVGNNSGRSKNININANYKHTFDSLGKEITTDLDYGYYDNKGSNLLITKALNADNAQVGNTISLKGSQPSMVDIYSGKVDYVHPFSKSLKLEAGIKSSYVTTDNNVLYMRDTSTGWYDDIERSNHFIFEENINAAYGIFTASIKKWELSAGLRIENTNAKGQQMEIDSSFTRKYTNLFPNMGAVYSINDKNQLSFAYSRRVRRPDYDDLNPFVYFIDSLTYGQGNPYLQPEFSNRFELSHTYRNFLTFTISHTRTSDIITQLLKQNTEKKTTFQTTENFAKRRQWGASISLNKQLVKWWNLSLYSGVFNNQYKGLYNDGKENIPIEVAINVIDANMTNSFSFAKVWTGEVSGWFSSSPSDGLIIGRPMGR